ncbi:MAG TPA: hypothetical protein VEI96_02375 [Thermodesulfovibrionales bacterium]|nr:hypothetical protein [Thermodesulfovibrionales bacterium]
MTLLTLLVACALSPAAWSCAFDDLSDAEIAREAIYMVYPGSAMVSSAVWHAQMEGVLERNASAAITDSPHAAILARAGAALTQLKARLALLEPMPPRQGLAVALLDSALWTRYELHDGELQMTVDVDGPALGDVVLVSEYAAIEALAAGSMNFAEARKLGVLRLYGDARAKARIQHWLMSIL